MEGGRKCWIEGGKTVNEGISNMDGDGKPRTEKKGPWMVGEESICEQKGNLWMEGEIL